LPERSKNMGLENIRIAKSSLTDNIYAGYLSKDKMRWLKKVDVTNDFLQAVIDRWAGFGQTITGSNGKKYRITLKKL